MKKRIIALFLIGVMLLTGCGASGTKEDTESKNTESENSSEATVINRDEIFRELCIYPVEWEFSNM